MIALDKLRRVDDAESFRQATDAMRQIVLHGHHSFDLDSGAILKPSDAVTNELQSSEQCSRRAGKQGQGQGQASA
jgi:hypothetical protein